MKKQRTEEELYYFSLSEVHLAEIQDFQEPIIKILIAKGVMTEIESDLIKFLKKSKPTDKSEAQSKRIAILNDTIDYFSNMATTSYQMKLMLRRASNDLVKERNEHTETKRLLDMVTNMLNEE